MGSRSKAKTGSKNMRRAIWFKSGKSIIEMQICFKDILHEKYRERQKEL